MIDRLGHVARLTSVRTEMEAGVIVAALEEQGIKATMAGVHTAHFRAEAPGWVEVLIADDDLPRAQELLDQVRREHDEIDWSQVDVGEREDEDHPDTVPWWMTLTFWRRVATILIVIYLVWFAASFAVGLIGGLLRSVGDSP